MNKLQHLQYLNLGRPSRYADNITAIQAKPSLDLNFARNKSLMDNVTGNNLVTFTRASSGTFVDSNGVLQRAVTNLLLRSEEFGTPWTLSNASVTSNAATSPNGTVTADSLIENSANSQHNISQTTTLQDNAVVTVSTYAKAFGRNWMRLSVIAKDGTVPGAYFDLSTGSTGSLISSPLATSITAVGNGWYRCSVTASIGSGVSSPGIRVWLATANNIITYTGDGTSGIYLWGAQLEQSTTVGEYIPTTSTINSAPRFDHNPVTGESLGLLVEEQRTNSITNNTMVGAVAGTPGTNPTGWFLTASANGISPEIVGTGVEDGITYVDIRYSGTSTSSGNFLILASTVTAITAAAGQSWTGSAYVKLQAGSLSNLTNTLQSVNGRSAVGAGLESTNAIYTPTSDGLGVQRRTVSVTLANASTARISHTIFNAAYASGVAIDITLRIGLPQLEQGAFATSVIPTTTAAATRSADVASITGANLSSWYRQDEGSFLVSTFAPKGLVIFGTGNTFDDTHYAVVGTSNNIAFRSGGASQEILSSAVSTTAITSLAIGYATNSFAAVSNGGPIATSASGSVSNNHAQLKIGSAAWNMGGGSNINGTIRRLTYFPQRLSNANLQRITQ